MAEDVLVPWLAIQQMAKAESWQGFSVEQGWDTMNEVWIEGLLFSSDDLTSMVTRPLACCRKAGLLASRPAWVWGTICEHAA